MQLITNLAVASIDDNSVVRHVLRMKHAQTVAAVCVQVVRRSGHLVCTAL